MDRAIRELVALGAPLPEAVAAATAPARACSAATISAALEPGARADVVVLDDDLHVRRTLVGGVQITP